MLEAIFEIAEFIEVEDEILVSDLDYDGDLDVIVVDNTSNGIADDLVMVDGYFRPDGTWVDPYYRTIPDGDPSNNLEAFGLVNA